MPPTPPAPLSPNEPEQTGFKQPILAPRTPSQQSWGTILALVIIVAMIVVGAFYTWGKRVAEERALEAQIGTTTETY